MGAKYNAVIQQHEDWWIGWIEEVPGVNSPARNGWKTCRTPWKRRQR